MSDLLLKPSRLWSRPEVLIRPTPVPSQAGVYAWYFRGMPRQVPYADCHRHGALTLLYVGISPKAPSGNGHPPSRQTLRERVRNHYRGDAEGSTLRLTLGCLLEDELGIRLQRVGGNTRMTFSEGEKALSQWMEENAFVVWMSDPEPWRLEEELIGRLSLPLNLDQNKRHPFHATLSQVRRAAKERARRGPVAG